MKKCNHYDCGWCYAPQHVHTSATNGACKTPETCNYYKKMSDTKSNEIIEINGVKYQRIQEELPQTLYEKFWERYLKYESMDIEQTTSEFIEGLISDVEEWLPKDRWSECMDAFDRGHNSAIHAMKTSLYVNDHQAL
jgi:hypothetical protein